MRRLLLALLLASSIAHAADVGLSPPRLELSARPGETVVGTVTVLTTAGTEQRIAVEASDWTLDTAGALTFLPAGSLLTGASDWLELETDEFTLAPRSSREVRVAVTIPDDPDLEGTFHAMVFFAVVPAATDAPGVGVVTTTRIGLTLYVTIVGTERGGSELLDFFEADDGTLVAVVVNAGNTVMRLGGAVEFRDEAGVVRHVVEVPDVPVLRESERDLTFGLPEGVEPGFYVALALIQDSRGGVLAGESPIEVP
jgi:hypothetical protein